MKIVLLSRDKTLYSSRRLIEAAVQRGHQLDVIDPLLCQLNICPSATKIYYQEDELPRYDAAIPRFGSLTAFHGLAILRQLELWGCYSSNSFLAISQARDKLAAMQLLAQHGVALPKTGFAGFLRQNTALMEWMGKESLVIKWIEGSQGIGVMLAESHQAAESIIDAFRGLNTHVLLQEYIEEAKGSDVRCFVIGGRVVAAIERQAQKGEFRSNLHRGGCAKEVQLTMQERALAVRATSVLGLKIAGVDILRSHRGPLVMEVNASPGLEGIENITGIDIADRIIEFIELSRK